MAFTSFEGAIARKPAQENFPFFLIFVTDEAKSKEKAAEGVFLVFHGLFRSADALLIFAHLAKGC
ncbi:hypothetical protein L0N00_17360, partial [Eggerthella lenta]|nr:hypothetical protein [Eggerthella lenta]